MDRWTDRWMKGYMDEIFKKEGLMGGWMNRGIDALRKILMDIRKNRQTDRQTDKSHFKRPFSSIISETITGNGRLFCLK